MNKAEEVTKSYLVADVLKEDVQQTMCDMVVVVANRIFDSSEGHMNAKLANPMAIQMLRGYLLNMLAAVCERDGIDIEAVPTSGGTEISLTVRTRH